VFPNIDTKPLGCRVRVPSPQRQANSTVEEDESLEFGNSLNPSDAGPEEASLQESRPKSVIFLSEMSTTEAPEQKARTIPQHRHRLLSKAQKPRTAEMGSRDRRELLNNRIMKNINELKKIYC
jgi:hypothetical protein